MIAKLMFLGAYTCLIITPFMDAKPTIQGALLMGMISLLSAGLITWGIKQ